MKKRSVEVAITSLSKKGQGLGSWISPEKKQYTIEVPWTLPGDDVKVEIERKRRGVYPGKLETIISPSQERIEPLCAHFGSCGGCQLQHLSLSHQLQYKTALISNCFHSLLTPEVILHPIIPSEPWHYRNKMEYSFSSDSHGKKYLGLVLQGSSGKVFNLAECHLTNHWFVKALTAVRKWWLESEIDAYHMHRDTGSLRTLILREGIRTKDRMAILTVSGNPNYALRRSQLEQFVSFLREAIEPENPEIYLSIFLRIQQCKKAMATQMYEMVLHGEDHIREQLHISLSPPAPSHSFLFNISPSAFFQPNTLQAEKVYTQVYRLASPGASDVVYDLYCGTGALGIVLARAVKQVIGIELSPESVLDARQNVTNNQLTNVMIYSGSVEQVLKKESLPKPDIILVDPPRAGLDRHAMDQIIALKPKKIIYVSCNPITQAANSLDLLHAGYRIREIQPIDQFPQTYHVENIVCFTNNDTT